MTEDLFVRKLNLPLEQDSLCAFLTRHTLYWEDDIEAAFGIFDLDETLWGCGCAAGSLLKCFAVDESLRGQNALGPLICSSSPVPTTRCCLQIAGFTPSSGPKNW